MARTKGSLDKKARMSARPFAWKAMRFWFKRGEAFSVRDLMAVVGCSKDAASTFIRDLRGAGLLVFGGYAVPGLMGGAKAWKLAKDMGPACPIVGKGAVRDMNLKAKGAKKQGGANV
jgi:hypothetical protein